MRNFLIILFLTCTVNGFSQELLKYSSMLIPDSLKKDADGYYQLEEMVVDIQSASKMQLYTHTIYTMLNRNAIKHTTVNIGVDKFRKLDEVSVKVYNDLGVEVLQFKKKDFQQEGAYDGITLASDDKVYTLSFPVPTPPCTIETEYNLVMSGYIDIPQWYFGSSTESFKLSRYVVKSSIPVQYKTYNTDLKPVVTDAEGKKVFTWEMKNKKVPQTESGSYGPAVYMPLVDVSPVNFSYDDYAGSLATWKDFGKWSFPFYEEENPFTPEKISFFTSLIANAKTEKEKIAILYNYLQKETRYVSIQYGIGGYKPFPVSFAEKKKYGDCKGLTHYMKNILKAAGIKSYAALINAGTNAYPVDPEFATNRFNHVILCVPVTNDTVWLECTGKQTLPGVLGSFTENRNALLITENGGVIVKTPASRSLNNRWISKATAELFEDGSSLIRSRVFVSGEFWESIYYYSDGKTKDEIKKALVNTFGYKAPDEFEFKILNDSADGHNIEIALSYYKYFDFKAGSKHFFPLRQYKLNDETIKPAETRKYDYLFDFPYIKTDSVTFKLPANFKKESLPGTKELKNNFVQYYNNVTLNETQLTLTVTTRLELKDHIIPPKQFNEVAGIFEAIKKDEAQKIILKQE
ncbi:MAG: DUF3857 domain-containing protein [Lacibacter sp.]